MSQQQAIDAQYVAGKLTSWSEKSGKTIEELKTRFQEIYAKTPGKTESVRYKNSLNALKRTFESSMNSNAITYKVLILGVAAPFDAVKKRRKELKERYDRSPAEMMASGEAIREGGEPIFIETKKTLPSGKENPFFGKPIPEHSWVTNCVAVAMKPTEDKKWIPANIILRGEEFIQKKIPVFNEIEVRLNGNFSVEQGRYNLTSSKGATNFDALGKVISEEELTNIVNTVYGAKFVLAGDLETNLEKTKGDQNRFVVTEGILNGCYKNDTGLSNIVLGDESLDLGETVKGFVDSSISHMLNNLESGDEVVVIGKTSYSKGYENGHKTDEDVLSMNVYSVFAKPV